MPTEFDSLAAAIAADPSAELFEALDLMIPSIGTLHEEVAIQVSPLAMAIIVLLTTVMRRLCRLVATCCWRSLLPCRSTAPSALLPRARS